ncbi:MAG: DUF1080 domain-containing protein, partial [Planctomycetaceae bacterium]|nr:DUF1080 domain-containing protein [Planctomycetaceae bacterium]
MRTTITALGLGIILLVTVLAFADEPGYTDTPLIPGSAWRVHDKARPQPPLVEPGRGDLGTMPPSDALVLFDGKNLDQWIRSDGKAIEDGIKDGAFDIMKTGQIQTKQEFV